MRRKIEPYIKSDEILIRCLLHPYWAKKGKMIRNALLPPYGHSDVSLLRLRYTNLDFCKRHAKSIDIPDAKYWGLGAILSKHVDQLNMKREEIGIAAKLVATPLNESFNIINNINVYTDTLGLPMHADLVYDEPMVKGEPSTSHRQYARELLKVAKFKEDMMPDTDKWQEEEFNFNV